MVRTLSYRRGGDVVIRALEIIAMTATMLWALSVVMLGKEK